MNKQIHGDGQEEASDRFGAIVEESPWGLHLYKMDGEGRLSFIGANPSADRILGIAHAGLAGLAIEEAFPGLKDTEIPSIYKGLALRGGVWKTEQIDYSEGAIRGAFEVTAFRIAEGEMAAAFVDITDRKKTEAALKESETRFRTLFETMTQAVVYQDAQGRVIMANAEALRVLGLSLDQLLGKTSMDPRWKCIREDGSDLEGKDHPAMKALATGKEVRGDIMGIYVPELDCYRWVLINAVPLFHEGENKPFQVYAVFNDITDRKMAEEALQKRERRFSQLVQNSYDTIVILDAEGIQRYVSPSAERVHGYSVEELIDIPVIDVMIHPDDREKVRSAFEGIFKTGEAEVRYRHKRKGGGWVHLEAHGSNQLDNPDIGGIVVNVHDITARILAEEEREKLQGQLLQSQKLESVGRLAGGVAHDFNNMLGVILGHAELALRRIGQDDALRSDLEQIQKAAQRSAGLTSQLLAFARRQTVAPKILDLNETIEKMLLMLRRLIGEDINLTWMPGPGLGQVFIDPSQLDQALTNLCVNARDAISGTGSLKIETANASFDQEDSSLNPGSMPGEFVLLMVSDDGCGMDKETMANIFEPFYTTKDVGKGTGLGLATVYGIVNQNKGFIQVSSEPGHGSTFRIYLPRHMGQAAPREEAEHERLSEALEGTILLVEDEPSMRMMTAAMLEQMGFSVLMAESPQEALDIVRDSAGSIDLLMTDVIMPGMGGRELARRIEAMQPGMKQLYMSGYTADIIARHGVLDPGLNFIQKPFSMENLGAKLYSILWR